MGEQSDYYIERMQSGQSPVGRRTQKKQHKQKKRQAPKRTYREVLFELSTRGGHIIASSIMQYALDVTDEQISKEYDEWEEDQLGNLRGSWSNWGDPPEEAPEVNPKKRAEPTTVKDLANMILLNKDVIKW